MNRTVALVAAVALVVVDGVVAACLTERDIPPLKPRALAIAVVLEPATPEAPRACPAGAHVDVVEGPVPDGALVLGVVTTSTREKHASLAAHEHAVTSKPAVQALCPDGLSVLSASETGAGVSDARMKLWRRPPTIVDAGP